MTVAVAAIPTAAATAGAAVASEAVIQTQQWLMGKPAKIAAYAAAAAAAAAAALAVSSRCGLQQLQRQRHAPVSMPELGYHRLFVVYACVVSFTFVRGERRGRNGGFGRVFGGLFVVGVCGGIRPEGALRPEIGDSSEDQIPGYWI